MTRSDGEARKFWLLPDMGPGNDLDSIMGYRDVAMPIARFHQLSRDLICQIIPDKQEAA